MNIFAELLPVFVILATAIIGFAAFRITTLVESVIAIVSVISGISVVISIATPVSLIILTISAAFIVSSPWPVTDSSLRFPVISL
jgi:hypothetical protein